MAFNSEPTIVKRNIQRAFPYLIQKKENSWGIYLLEQNSRSEQISLKITIL